METTFEENKTNSTVGGILSRGILSWTRDVCYLCVNFSLPMVSLFSTQARCVRQTNRRQTPDRRQTPIIA